MKINKQALKEAAKELGRVLLLAGIGWGVSYVSNLPSTQTTVIVLAVLRWVDKYIHESKDIKVNGLVPF
jgi:hypothetical protein